MEYRRLGRTGLKVSEVCAGTMTFGRSDWGIDEKQSGELVDLAIDAGVNFFDTANSYSEGESETILGKLVRGRRDKLILATKVFNPMGTDINDSGTSRVHIMKAVEDSLSRLQTDYIDLYYIHHVDRETPTEERLRALDDLVRQGKVRYIACSNEYAWRLCDALWVSEVKNLNRYECVQSLYNLLTRDIEEEILPLCIEKQVGVTVWSPLAAGYLTGKYKPGTAPPENTRFGQTNSSMRRYFPPQEAEVIETLREVADNLDKSMAQIALRWILEQAGITSVIVGATKVEQLKDNLGCSGWHLPAELLAKLNEVSECTSRYPHSMQANMHERRSDAVQMPSL
jgi:aryl-alcohol dehydrogenase-like predicted oxidoreductase